MMKVQRPSVSILTVDFLGMGLAPVDDVHLLDVFVIVIFAPKGCCHRRKGMPVGEEGCVSTKFISPHSCASIPIPFQDSSGQEENCPMPGPPLLKTVHVPSGAVIHVIQGLMCVWGVIISGQAPPISHFLQLLLHHCCLLPTRKLKDPVPQPLQMIRHVRCESVYRLFKPGWMPRSGFHFFGQSQPVSQTIVYPARVGSRYTHPKSQPQSTSLSRRELCMT